MSSQSCEDLKNVQTSTRLFPYLQSRNVYDGSLLSLAVVKTSSHCKTGCKSRSAFDAHIEPLFNNLRILILKGIYKLKIGKLMYQYKSGLLNYSFNNMFFGGTLSAFLWH